MRGFSLLELSIALIIIGLIVGGILVGHDMIRQAELRSVMTDVGKFKTAVNTFKLKYNALPGDQKNATSYWDAAHTTPATCRTTVGTGTQTCDGDGNGIVSSASAGSMENFRFWQHLANAGLIEGQFSGVTGPAHPAEDSQIGTNVPASKMAGTGYSMNPMMTLSGSAHYFDGSYGNAINFGTESATANTYGPALIPEAAASIDEKMDDGKPAYGVVTAFKSSSTINPNCTTAAVSSTSEYALTSKSALCSLVFTTGF